MTLEEKQELIKSATTEEELQERMKQIEDDKEKVKEEVTEEVKEEAGEIPAVVVKLEVNLLTCSLCSVEELVESVDVVLAVRFGKCGNGCCQYTCNGTAQTVKPYRIQLQTKQVHTENLNGVYHGTADKQQITDTDGCHAYTAEEIQTHNAEHHTDRNPFGRLSLQENAKNGNKYNVHCG